MLSTPILAGATTRHLSFEDELVQEIALALRRSGYLELIDIDVIVDGHDVLLRGRVPSYFLKQKAEFLARSLPNVATLNSDIEVTKG